MPITVRPTMADLVARVRVLIADPAGITQQFDDATIQQALDDTRVEALYAELTRARRVSLGGITNYNTFYAGVGDWEQFDTTLAIPEGLYGPGYATLAPTTSDYLSGKWTFAIAAPGQPLPVFIVGKFYDRYAAAAALLEQWAAALARAYDFSTGTGQTLRRSQQATMLLTQAERYRAQARPLAVTLTDDGEVYA